ncbi:MAG: hypothetical protein DRP32_06580, partial [Thermotogae bacterium]
MSDATAPRPLAETFSSLSADTAYRASQENQVLGAAPSAGSPETPVTYPDYNTGSIRVQNDEYTMMERAYPGLSGGPQIIKENKSSSDLVARSVMTPNLDRTFNQLVEQTTATEYI